MRLILSTIRLPGRNKFSKSCSSSIFFIWSVNFSIILKKGIKRKEGFFPSNNYSDYFSKSSIILMFKISSNFGKVSLTFICIFSTIEINGKVYEQILTNAARRKIRDSSKKLTSQIRPSLQRIVISS